MALLQIRNLACRRDDRLLFERLNISLDAGQLLLVAGYNGSGKTSFLRLLTGLKLPDEGDILWAGTPVSTLAADYYEQINYVGHHDGIKRELTCLENLRLIQAMGVSTQLSLADVLEQVNLYRYGDTLAGCLSAGQKRRLAFARLLTVETKLWILDEPFTALDKKSVINFSALLIQHLQQQGMIVMTSHHDISLPGVNLQQLNLST